MEWYFKVKAATDNEARQKARNMAIEVLRKKGMIGRWFEVQDITWLQRGLFGDGILANVHVYVKDGAIMNNAKVKSYLAQEFRDLKARLSKKKFKDQKSKWIAGLNEIKDSLKNFKDEIVKKVDWRGYHIWIQKWNNKYSFSVYSGASSRGNPFAHDDGFESIDEAYNAAVESAKAYISHYGDSAIKDTKQVVQYKGYTITVYVEKDQTICNITKNGKDIGGFSSFSGMNMNEAMKAAKKEVDEDIKFGDSAENVEDADLNELGKYISKEDLEYLKSIDFPKTHTKRAQEILNKYVKLKNNADSAEHINDRKIDIKKDGKLIDTVNAETLSEAVRIYERQHPELKGQIDAYFSDEKVKDARIEDSLSEKAKQLISKAVAEARFDYKTAMDFAIADLKAEKEWAWTSHAEVSQMVQRLIKNRLDF